MTTDQDPASADEGAAARGFTYRPDQVPDDFLAVEIFGYPPDCTSRDATLARAACACPFKGGKCTKLDSQAGTGVCSIRYKAGAFLDSQTWAVCANRLAGDPFADVVATHFGERAGEVSLAKEVQIKEPKMSFDAVGLLQVPDDEVEFIGIEAQTIDTRGGSVRLAWDAYVEGEPEEWRRRYTEAVPKAKSFPGVNFTNVWKRLLPQVMNKGRMYAEWDSQLYVLLQSNVFEFIRARMPLRELARQERGKAEIIWMPWDYTGEVGSSGQLKTEIGAPFYNTVDQIETAFLKVAATQRPAFVASVISKLERTERQRLRQVQAKAEAAAANQLGIDLETGGVA